MSLSTVVDVFLIGIAVVWVLARQIRLARVKPRLLVLAPLVLAYFGIRALPPSTWACGAGRPSRCGAGPTAPGGGRDRCARWPCGER
jgi:hypothetical protein